MDRMFPARPTQLAQEFLRGRLADGDVAVDATAGNGHDTVFLAGCVGASGKVLAFDVQAAAVEATRERVRAGGVGERVEVYHESHEGMTARAGAGTVAAVMFNLGYLPGEDHAVTTEAEGTLRALEAAAVVLRPGGALCVVCYPGHEAGAIEAGQVEEWMTARAGEGWRVVRYGAVGTKRPAPFLLLGAKPTSAPRAGLPR